MEQRAHITQKQLRGFLKEAERAGVDTRAVLQSLGFDSKIRAVGNDCNLSLVDFFRIEGEVARRLDDLTAHLSERRLTFETGAFVTTQLNRSTTLCDAISNLAKHFNMMHGEHYNTMRVTDRTVSLIIDDSTFPYTMRDDPEMVHFVGECVLIQVFCLLDSLSEGLAAQALHRIAIKRPNGQDVPAHLRFWNVQMAMGQDTYALSFDHELAHSPMSKTGEIDLSSEGVYSRVISYLESNGPDTVSHSFKARTLGLIRQGMLQQDQVAHRLSVSVATLRRRLEQEDTSFRELVNEHRMADAVALLKKGFSVSHVSDALDYSDIRAFNRAFKRWKGETPARFAKRAASSTEQA